MNVLTHILFGLTAWTTVSIVVGLGLGAFLKYGGAADDFAPVAMPAPMPVLRKSA
jgi:hypothetical protein